MTDLLFVYGTLMRAAHAVPLGNAERARLAAAGAHLGAATMAGRLYDLGDYPAMTEPGTVTDVVHGEVYRLSDPAASFGWLDAYEGISDDEPDPDYARRVRRVVLEDGSMAAAWVYLWLKPLADCEWVPDGRWHAEAGRTHEP